MGFPDSFPMLKKQVLSDENRVYSTQKEVFLVDFCLILLRFFPEKIRVI